MCLISSLLNNKVNLAESRKIQGRNLRNSGMFKFSLSKQFEIIERKDIYHRRFTVIIHLVKERFLCNMVLILNTLAVKTTWGRLYLIAGYKIYYLSANSEQIVMFKHRSVTKFIITLVWVYTRNCYFENIYFVLGANRSLDNVPFVTTDVIRWPTCLKINMRGFRFQSKNLLLCVPLNPAHARLFRLSFFYINNFKALLFFQKLHVFEQYRFST